MMKMMRRFIFSSLLISSLKPALAFTSKGSCQGAFFHLALKHGWMKSGTYLASSAKEEFSTSSFKVVGPDLPEVQPMAKRLFLVRHGEVINPGGDRPVYYGAMDVPLSPLGEAEAKAAASYLQQFDLEYVVSSPLSRAVFGAEQVLSMQSGLQNDIVQIDGFKELDRGYWCGKTKDEIGPAMMASFDECDESVTPEGGESYPYLKKRVLEARDTVLDMLPAGRAAAIVSHLQVTRSILSDALEIPINEMAGLKVATASVTCIDYDMVTGTQMVHYQSFKADAGLEKSKDGAN
jgi:broad specificity phosphatase PhoE